MVHRGQVRRSQGVKALLSLAFVALAAAATFGSATNSFTTADVVGISSLALAVNALLLGVTIWLVRSRAIANAIIAGTTLGGLLTMHVVHTDAFGAGVRPCCCRALPTSRCSSACTPLTTGRGWALR